MTGVIYNLVMVNADIRAVYLYCTRCVDVILKNVVVYFNAILPSLSGALRRPKIGAFPN